MQKFALPNDESGHPVLNDRHNIVVISDEAHRSQYGLKATLKKDGTYKFGYARHMRDALPNASFIGFTGTPIESEDKDTRAVFGDYVSIYDIQDAVDDGATVPIFYESRLARLDIIHGMFAPGPKGKGFDYRSYQGMGFETEPHKLLVPTANYVLSLEDGKKRFLDTVLAMNKAFSLCGLDKPNIGLLSDEFLEDVRQMPYKNFAVELLEKLLKDGIKARTRNNVVQEKKYADRLKETLRKSTTVDWQVRESVRAKLRILVRRTLQRYKYPPDKAPAAIELIMEQAEALSNHWTM